MAMVGEPVHAALRQAVHSLKSVSPVTTHQLPLDEPPAAVPSQLAQASTQLCWRAPGRPVSSMKFVRSGGGWARSFHVESLGPALQDLGAYRVEQFVRGAALGRRRFAPPRRALSRQLSPPWPVNKE